MENLCRTDMNIGVDTQQTTLTAQNFKGTTIQMSTSTLSMREFIAHELALVKEVEAILTARQGNELHVWTVVNEFDAAVRAKVYEREKSIIDEFANIHFDFNILSRRNRPFDEVVHDSSLEVTYRR